MIKLTSAPKPLKGEVYVPGDKSISHRSVMFAALAEGTSQITGFLEGADCLSTIDCFRKMGVLIERSDRPLNGVPTITVHGQGLHGLKEPTTTLYTGNSGTTTRLMAGILAAQEFDTDITGDESIEKRPMGRIIRPLSDMGASVTSVKDNGCCPLHIEGGHNLRGIVYHNQVASAQVKSCILLAGLYAQGDTVVHEPALSRNHTEIMLRYFGADVHNDATRYGPSAAVLHPGMPLYGRKINVPGDISSAAYFIAAALLVPGSEVLIHNVGINGTRAGFLAALKQMGADITLLNENNDMEPRADILVRYSELRSPNNDTFELGGKMIPTMIDEIPMFAVLAAVANCKTIIKDAAELKVKESNRIDTIVDNLKAMGADITATEDGMIINGGKPLHGAVIDSHKDHRIAMSFAIASLVASGETKIKDEKCVDISYPTFFRDFNNLKNN
ncbi:3-phosphoshikimate 1-carboxyvinyltransferase [Butyrivibrio fibrisolvens]|uniref:3-phosphoshikimate 1-carboxyvinyltransferase n=1 Tax=Butyrivibrio fibrisolvens TaxID=831 RepID=A0A317G1A2_BUTFI|nr:3-phosphoshikimate 1-carboxyvinyltransferase [Butyrivibrio fibrisolvens]PWT27844.1 3-phosphoshikimate 1-carboxyvinyltransferase [Butyrivibrio fibrisolvens]